VIAVKRLDREIAAVTRERDEALARRRAWNGDAQLHRARALAAELDRLQQQRAVLRGRA
jgi:hypothetical protein